MDIVEKEALNFFSRFKSDCQILLRAQNQLSEKLYSFKTDKNKLYFLTVLRKEFFDKKNEHEKDCTMENCSESQQLNTGLFVLDEQLEELNRYYSPEIKTEDNFSNEDKANLHTKLNEILDRFEKMNFGQQVIHEEIEELRGDIDTLKQHFDLGKKSWFQLAFVKFAGISAAYGIEDTIVKGMYSELTREVENMGNFLLNQ